MSHTRIVRVREVGDRWRNHNKGLGPELMLRVQGKWLKDAGFEDGQEVYIHNPVPGQLILMTQIPVGIPVPTVERCEDVLIAHYVREG